MDTEQAMNMALDDVVQLEKSDNKESKGETVETVTVGKRCYVGNLSWRTSWQDLKDHFRQVGNVVFAEVMLESGPERRSKGCGIVEFETPDEAAKAIIELHDSVLEGRKILVREDREDYELKKRQPHHGRQRGGGNTSGRRVFVANLAWETTWQDLKDHFKQAGDVVYADVMKDGERSKGCGIVEFGSAEEAAEAISKMSDSYLHERKILVREDREEGKSGYRKQY